MDSRPSFHRRPKITDSAVLFGRLYANIFSDETHTVGPKRLHFRKKEFRDEFPYPVFLSLTICPSRHKYCSYGRNAKRFLPVQSLNSVNRRRRKAGGRQFINRRVTKLASKLQLTTPEAASEVLFHSELL